MHFRLIGFALFLAAALSATGCCCWRHHRCQGADPAPGALCLDSSRTNG